MNRVRRTSFWILLLTIMQVALSACSVQWRDADSSSLEPRVAKSVDALRNQVGAASGNSGLFFQLYESPYSQIYYGISDTGEDSEQGAILEMGYPWSLLSIVDFSVFGRPEVGALDLVAALVILIDDPQSGQASLVVDFADYNSSGYTTRYFSSVQPPFMDGEELVFQMNGLTLRTHDVDESGVMNTVAQFRVYEVDASGAEYFIGKFSSLMGFQ